MIKSHYFSYSEKKINFKLKSVQVMVCLHLHIWRYFHFWQKYGVISAER